jgi:hypothetical protein
MSFLSDGIKCTIWHATETYNVWSLDTELKIQSISKTNSNSGSIALSKQENSFVLADGKIIKLKLLAEKQQMCYPSEKMILNTAGGEYIFHLKQN